MSCDVSNAPVSAVNISDKLAVLLKAKANQSKYLLLWSSVSDTPQAYVTATAG